ncbi:hypothetical protein HKD37_06G014599 [Glycine soja]
MSPQHHQPPFKNLLGRRHALSLHPSSHSLSPPHRFLLPFSCWNTLQSSINQYHIHSSHGTIFGGTR